MQVKDVRDDLPSNGDYPKRTAQEITHIDIHHSATPQVQYEGFSTIESFASYHINHHNWPGLGYHYVISPSGVIYKTGYANESRWSVGGHNSYSISIMLIGNFIKEDPALEQYYNAVKLAEQMCNAYNVEKQNVMGHREYPDQSPHCPGIDMDKFRKEIHTFKRKE